MLLVLAGLGLTGNAFHIPLFFGVDFLSGSIFVFLALALFGTRAGVGVAALAGACTYFLWGHPYAWLNMLIQTLLVGAGIRCKRNAVSSSNIPTWVVLYWLVLGLPLIAGLYHYVIGMDWQGALMVAFKQASNDVLNALIAALVLHYFPLRRWSGLPTDAEGSTLRNLQTNLLAAFTFFPALVVIMLISRAEVIAVEETIKMRLIARSAATSLNLGEWIGEHMQVAQALAQQVERGTSLTAAELQRDLRFFANASPSVAAIHIVDASGQVVLSSGMPPGAKGADLSDREWFRHMKVDGKPALALIPKGRMLAEPFLVFVAPILQGAAGNASLRGGVVLTYKVSSFQNMFSAVVLEDSMRATLVDRNNSVIVSSEPRFSPGKDFDKQRGGRVAERMGEVYRWQPEEIRSAMQGWASSYYARHVALGDSGWILVIESPLNPHFAVLQQKVLNGFIVIFVLVLGAFLVGGWLGRRIVRPLQELGMVTTRLAQSVSGDELLHLRHHGLHEIDALVDNFRSMARSLKQNYAELMAIRRDLEQRVEERTADLIRQAGELQRSRDEAESSSRAKSDFLSSMSHEMRTPMNAILGFSQFLQTEDLTADHAMSVNEIYKAGMHLLALIDEVLDLAKIEAGHIDLSLEPVEVYPVVNECLMLVGTLADKRGIRISHGGLEGAAVRADRVRLKQVLLNLLSNAIKYNREGGSVKLAVAARNEQWLQIRVTDTGPGIPAERLQELFQPFNRLDAENSAIEGTGIGLTITRRLIEMMGGTVDVESEVGVGSTFWVELPLEIMVVLSAEQTKLGTGGTPQRSEGSARHTVLYIEDNPANLRLVAQILGRHKHVHLLTAHTPELGIELAQARRPDLILLDINMPGLDGYQVLKIFQADANLRAIPVVAITANAMPRDIERGKAAGFTDYLTKPLDVVRFEDVMHHLLGIESMRKEDAAKPAARSAPAASPQSEQVDASAKTGGDEWERF